jgi:CheY-like chemotaxis protein
MAMGAGKTTLNPQPWPWSGPRVLVEHRDEAAGMALASSLREAGYAVAVCPGPDKAERCPLTGPEGCAVAHGADVIVSSLDLDRPEAREAVQALRARCPDTPLIVEVAPGKEAGWDFLAGCELVVSPISPDRLVAAVDQALSERRGES